LHQTQANRTAVGLGSYEASLLKPLHQQAHPVATPPEHLEQVAALAAKHEYVAAERIAFEYSLHLRCETVESGTHVVTPAASHIRVPAGRPIMDGKLTEGVFKRSGIDEFQVARNISFIPLGNGKYALDFMRGLISTTEHEVYFPACEVTAQ
jgi:hypothetical protein